MELGRLLVFILGLPGVSLTAIASIAEKKTTCEAPSVFEGEAGKVTCHLTEDVRETKKPFRFKKFGFDSFQHQKDPVLDCWFNQTQFDCSAARGYTFEGVQGKLITLGITSAVPENAGRYLCQTIPSDPDRLEVCSFIVKNKTDQLREASTITPRDNTTVPAASASSETGVKVVLPVILVLVAGTVLVLGIVFRDKLKERLRSCCNTTAESRNSGENGTTSTLMKNNQSHRQNGTAFAENTEQQKPWL